MNEPHLSDIALIVLAARRAPHPHFENCAWCREQYETLIAMENMESEDDAETHSSALNHAATESFRLAAQSDIVMDADLVLRQTWYLDEGRVLLRVFEETPDRLIGYIICAPERLSGLRIHFSGIAQTFIPAVDGSFLIGASNISIEPMSVTLEEF